MGERERVFGCLFGLAVGDALGAPVEGMPREEVRKKFGRVTEMMGGGWLNLKPGEVTDDTELALQIAKSIADEGQVDLEAIARNLVAWLKGKPKDVGGQTYQALQAIIHGVPPHEAGRLVWEQSGKWLAGNGCVMRTAPIGLFLRRASFEERGKASRLVAGITHGDPRCLDSCALIDHIIAFLATEGNISFGEIITWARGMQFSLARRIESIPRAKMDELSTGEFVLDTVQSAIWFLVNSQSFEDGLIDAVSLGQDADTTGAVTGALLGAKFGFDAIPRRWLDALHCYDEIERYASYLYENAPGKALI